MDFIGGSGRETANPNWSSLITLQQIVTAQWPLLQSVCTECECVRPGVNVCQGQVVVLAMDQLYLPGWCPPKPRPSYVPTSTNTIQRADYPRCVPCTMRASGPSGGVQLGVGELVSALAAPSPLIAGANTILAIYFHFPILTSSCSC